MGELLSYSILSGLLALAMYLPYRAFLARENQHTYNRAILLSIYALAFAAVPFMKAMDHISFATAEPAVSIMQGKVVVDAVPAPTPIWGTILIWIYMAGMAAVGVKTVMVWAKLAWIVSRGERLGMQAIRWCSLRERISCRSAGCAMW